MTVFALRSGTDFAAEVMNDEVQAVADAKSGKIKVEKRGIGFGRISIVNGRGTARENDAEGLIGRYFGDGRRAGQDDGEDVQFADTAGNELGVLRAEIQDNDGLGVHLSVWQGLRRTVKKVPCSQGISLFADVWAHRTQEWKTN